MESSSSTSTASLITPEDVLESLMNDGTIDALRLKIITQLKANEELKSTTIRMAEQSKVLNAPGAEKQTKRELFDALRQELEAPVLEKASRSVWELILDDGGLGKEISETVEKVYCRLSGRKPPLFPQPNATQLIDENEEKVEGKAEEQDSQKEKLNSSSKKRNYSEMNTEGGGNEVASKMSNEVTGKSGDPPLEDSSKSPQTSSKS